MKADDWSDRERRMLAAAVDLPGWKVGLTRMPDGRFRAVATYTKGWYLPCGHRSVSATGRTREIAVASLARAARFHCLPSRAYRRERERETERRNHDAGLHITPVQTCEQCATPDRADPVEAPWYGPGHHRHERFEHEHEDKLRHVHMFTYRDATPDPYNTIDPIDGGRNDR